MKKIIVIIATISMVFTSALNVYAADFSDVKQTNWAYEAIKAMSEKAVITGYPGGSFKPMNTVTYGEFIKMALVAATGKDVGNSTSGNWAEGYYQEALNLGYFTEYDIKSNAMNKQITRGHMALIISAILGDVKIDKYDEIQKGITDVTFKTPYEYDITKAYATGILTGYPDKTFKQEKTLSRAEAAIVIHRLVDESKRVVPGAVVETEPSTGAEEKTIDEMITNLRSFVGETGNLDEDLAEAETYEIDDAYAKYGMKVHENRGTKWVSFPNDVKNDLGIMYLIKDNKVIESMARWDDIAIYQSDITTMDYIASLSIYDHILLIANPFKQ
jgi:hypothetical protein